MKDIKEYLPYGAGILMSSIFGFSFLFTKNSLSMMDPLQILAYRFAAASLLLQVLRWTGLIKMDLKGKKVSRLLLLALIEPVIYFIFETTGLSLTSSSQAGMMMAVIPVFTAILGSVLLKEKPSLIQSAFITASVSGVAFIMLFQGTSDAGGDIWGILALTGAVFSAGMYNILSRKLSSTFRPVETTYVMMWVAAVVFNMAALTQNLLHGGSGNYIKPLYSFEAWIPVLYLGLLSSVGAFFMTNYMLSKLPASQSSVFSNLTTVISIMAGVIIRGETFHWYQAAGGALILFGVWGTNYFGRVPANRGRERLDGNYSR